MIYTTVHKSYFNQHFFLLIGTVKSIVTAPAGSQPIISGDEMVECEAAVINSGLFKEALKRLYNVTDASLVMVDIWSGGNYFNNVEDSSIRLSRPLCFLRSDATDNGYAHPLEQIRPVVDLNTMTVLRVEEYDSYPVPAAPGNYSYTRKDIGPMRDDIKPLLITQPQGPSFTLTGNHIAWQKWEFIIVFNAREGLTLHNICYRDGEVLRPIIFRASLTEMVLRLLYIYYVHIAIT